MTAEKILRDIINKLSDLNCDISYKRMENLKIRVDKEMNVINLLISLKDPSVSLSKTTLTF